MSFDERQILTTNFAREFLMNRKLSKGKMNLTSTLQERFDLTDVEVYEGLSLVLETKKEGTLSRLRSTLGENSSEFAKASSAIEERLQTVKSRIKEVLNVKVE